MVACSPTRAAYRSAAKPWQGWIGAAILLSGCGTRPAEASAESAPLRQVLHSNLLSLTNGVITVGIDLHKGGAIVYLAKNGKANMINDHDLGRQVQASFYSGPRPYGSPSPQWKDWNWNPIQSGDVYGNGAIVAAWEVKKDTLYTRVVPYQWALRATRCDCTFETWTTLDRATLHIRTRLTNSRSDTTKYPADPQELPAVYTNGHLRHLVSYTGPTPFAGMPVSNLSPVFPWKSWLATEGWSAYLDDKGTGLGVISPQAERFVGGFAGVLRDGDEHGEQTGYIGPELSEVLDHDIQYVSDVFLVLGTVDQIRLVARRLRRADPKPDYVFGSDRQHWWYINADDAGWPIHNGLRVDLSASDPQLWSPERVFDASTVPSLIVSAAFGGTGHEAQFFWKTYSDAAFSEAHSMHFEVIPDGRLHSYLLPLASQPSWSGSITALRFDPPDSGGGWMRLCAISWRPRSCLGKDRSPAPVR